MDAIDAMGAVLPPFRGGTGPVVIVKGGTGACHFVKGKMHDHDVPRCVIFNANHENRTDAQPRGLECLFFQPGWTEHG